MNPKNEILPHFYLEDEDAVIYELRVHTPAGFVWTCEVHERDVSRATDEVRALFPIVQRVAA